MAFAERMVHVDRDVRLHVVEAGPANGPAVVLLHGFPEFWYSWHKQLPALAAAGFHAIAPDMRGYNLSDKPRGVAPYRMELLTRDVANLLNALDIQQRASVVGHDWGAAVAWAFAMAYPDRLDRLAILNVPHPITMQKGLKRPGQLRKSWYIFFFQLPWLPEAIARGTGYAFVRQALRHSFTPAEIERYVQAIATPGALTSAINYYRAVGRYRMPPTRPIDRPVLVMWGERDAYLGSELAEPPHTWVRKARVERLSQASHWVHVDAAERVNELLVAFLHGE